MVAAARYKRQQQASAIWAGAMERATSGTTGQSLSAQTARSNVYLSDVDNVLWLTSSAELLHP